ncbi:putative quorum-quenching lactonase YtnP [Novipirellula aureliae]|uniref:Putative quorum-quenching lactonase YtnP n=1 Tax=Novipirellula aureliae TaxID=2527966 RepID=A0A5C6D9Q1_9BACT|nr:MBL fold metallo-hydrolase [Novipirellula aureliae]TWU33642.1 putative quorum-quenching lactonase YtnP [Novipirellula aureliae]
MRIGNWQLDLISGGRFRIDGGVLFGIVPRTVWQNVAPPVDSLHRTMVDTHCIVARDGQNVVLIDTGYGGKYSPLDRKVNDLEPREPIVEGIASLGIKPEEVTHVLFSHLHFDHAGGATRWTTDRQIVPTFPNARHWVHQWEWEDAMGQASEIRAAYPIQNIGPLAEAGLVDVFQHDGELLPGLTARLSGGHTRGHTCFYFEDAESSVLFIGDICPSAAHVRPQWHTAYELYPLQTRSVKPKILADAVERRTWVVWNHDIEIPVSRVGRGPKQEFTIYDTATGL